MESDMLYKVTSEGEKREDAFFKCVKKAADVTHTIALARAKSQKAADAIAHWDKEAKWRVLQEYMREYAPFINSTAYLTGITVQSVGIDFYNHLTLDDVNRALRTAIGFVYFKEAADSKAKDAYKACLKKLLKQTGLFDRNLLDRYL